MQLFFSSFLKKNTVFCKKNQVFCPKWASMTKIIFIKTFLLLLPVVVLSLIERDIIILLDY